MPGKCRSEQFVALLVGGCLAGAMLSASADETGDCARPVDASFDEELLTRDEKIEILNQRFYDELARFEECFNANSGGAAGGAAASGQGGGGGGASGSQTFSAATESLPVANVQGTELPEPEPDDSPAVEQDSMAMANGKAPEPLETADNDAILLEQIRQAAIAEEDPALKEKLWEEYNKRKSGRTADTPSANAQQANGTSLPTQQAVPTTNAAADESLATADNNTPELVEAIRQAAIAEQDPAMKEKLWQEYNKRKSGQADRAQSNEVSPTKDTSPSVPQQVSATNEPLAAEGNDSGLLEEIRQAAIAEQDPVMQEKLWQEYNKRKAALNSGS